MNLLMYLIFKNWIIWNILKIKISELDLEAISIGTNLAIQKDASLKLDLEWIRI